ncbi:hypothetical protein Droror1_Dr00016710 [Drosera rotundifolia]
MEALKAWSLSSSQQLKHLIAARSAAAFAALPRRRPSNLKSSIRCCSSNSYLDTAAVGPKQSGRNRRPLSSSSVAAPGSTSDRDAVRAIRIKKVEELRAKGLEPYAYKWERTHTAHELQNIYKQLANGEEAKGDSDHVSVAGRIMARRAFGKLAFLTLRDDSGMIQLYCEKEKLSGDQFDQLKTLVDIGDILGARGTMKRTEKGELSVLVTSFMILTKSLLPLPDKYHGLTDVEKRYRQRYVDMIANLEVAETFRKRAKRFARLWNPLDLLKLRLQFYRDQLVVQKQGHL